LVPELIGPSSAGDVGNAATARADLVTLFDQAAVNGIFVAQTKNPTPAKEAGMGTLAGDFH
jgi:hypothetical protein